MGPKCFDGGFGLRGFGVTLERRGVRTSSISADGLDNGSPADRHEIHAATRLHHEGITPRIKRGIMHAMKGTIWIDKEEITGAASERSHTIVQCH